MKDRMKLLPYSNGFYKIKHVKIIRPGSIIKNIALGLVAILLIGIGYQYLSDRELKDLTSKNKYVRIDSKKYYFNSVGEERPTIILDSDIGFGLSQWSRVENTIEGRYTLRTFAYDRAGYGLSDYSKDRTPEEQARLLRMILKKVALTGPFILVGEGYGSLVMCNFAMLYPDLVEGVILINPINEKALNDKEYMKQFSNEKLQRYTQKLGSYIGLNELLYNTGIIDNYDYLSNYMNEEDLQMYNTLRTKNNFNLAYYGELVNIIEKRSNSQEEGMFNEVPLVIVVNDNEFKSEQEELSKLGSTDLTKVINVSSETGVISLESSEVMLDAVRFILDNIKKEK